MRADRTVIVIGAFLFVVGLAAAWNGYLYIDLERGWSMMIAGTVGFSTGLLLVALGLVLRELRAIASSAAQGALLLAKAKSAGLPGIAAPPTPAPPPAEPEPARVAQEPEAQEPEAQAGPQVEPEWEPQWELEQALAAEALDVAPKEEAAFAPALEPPPGTTRPPAPKTSVGHEAVAEDARPAAADGDDWLYKTVAGPLAGVHEPPATEAAGAEAPAETHTGEPHPAEPGTTEAPREPEPLHVAHDEPAAQGSAAEAPLAEGEPQTASKEIIGHYDANGAHYTMYADGSIDAETAHGVYRFASMEELKRFIEGQD